MPQRLYFQVAKGLGVRGWLTILVALSLVVAITVAIAVVAVGVFLFLLPVIAITAAVLYLFPRSRYRRAAYRRPQDPQIIDGEFRIIDNRNQRDR